MSEEQRGWLSLGHCSQAKLTKIMVDVDLRDGWLLFMPRIACVQRVVDWVVDFSVFMAFGRQVTGSPNFRISMDLVSLPLWKVLGRL